MHDRDDEEFRLIIDTHAHIQTGATTHPGGSVSAGPGYNAAKVMLADLGTSLAAVLAQATAPA